MEHKRQNRFVCWNCGHTDLSQLEVVLPMPFQVVALQQGDGFAYSPTDTFLAMSPEVTETPLYLWCPCCQYRTYPDGQGRFGPPKICPECGARHKSAEESGPSDPAFPIEAWRYAVTNDTTRLGFHDWVLRQRSEFSPGKGRG